MKKRVSQEQYLFLSVLVGCVLFSGMAYAQVINSFSEMPANSTAIYPEWGIPNGFVTQLIANNISVEIWLPWDPNAIDGGWVTGMTGGCCSGASGFFAPDPSSTVAPTNGNVISDAVRFTFGNPVSAFGATFIATPNPPSNDPNTSFDDNYENATYDVQAFAADGTLLGVAHSSSWDVANGPRKFYVGSGPERVASFAGVSSSVPIHKVIISGIRPTDGARMSAFSNIYVVLQCSLTLGVSVSPNVLWPPNGNLIPIIAAIEVHDECDPAPAVRLVSITSNEPTSAGDIQGAAYGTDDRSFALKAARLGSGSGRAYTITYRATDAFGNSVDKSMEVYVPHDLSSGNAPRQQ